MTQSLSLSLQAFPPPERDKESLQYLIQRINDQRGSFRNVSEQSLEDEIRDVKAEPESDDHAYLPDNTKNDDDTDTKKEEVVKAREEILKQTA